jgi:hypothetical protein
MFDHVPSFDENDVTQVAADCVVDNSLKLKNEQPEGNPHPIRNGDLDVHAVMDLIANFPPHVSLNEWTPVEVHDPDGVLIKALREMGYDL